MKMRRRTRTTRLILRSLLWLLLGLAIPARAQTAPPAEETKAAQTGSEITVTGEEGATLIIDGKPVGQLPLSHSLTLPAGPHQFLLEVRNHRYRSDVLNLPEGRVAELSLTRGSHGTAIALLSLTPMIVLSLRSKARQDDRTDTLRQVLYQAAQEGARAEHAVVVPAERAAATQSGRAPDCATGLDCPLERSLRVAAEVEARMVLLLGIPTPTTTDKGATLCGLQGELFDVSTGQTAATAQAEPLCLGDDAAVADSVLQLVRKLVRESASVSRGTIAVTTNPSGARVTVDGRARGETPWQGPSLCGSREIAVELEGYKPQRTTATVLAGQTLTVPIELVKVMPVQPQQPPPPPPPPQRIVKRRPIWRLSLGGALLGAGALPLGFGVSGLVVAGQLDSTQDGVFGTRAIGGSLLFVGLAALAGGGVLLAWPPR